MATRFYLRNTTQATGISPTPDAAWEDTSNLVRAVANTTPTADAMADVVAPDDADDTDRDVILRQYVSGELTAGQTITGSQAIKAQCRCGQPDGTNNIFLTLGIRVLKADGVTVNKTVLAVTRDDVELPDAGVIENRQFTATSAATNYTTQTGDRLVIEIGGGGNPGGTGNHEFTLRIGDGAADDLPEDNTDTTDKRPWVELTDTVIFVVAGDDSDGTKTPLSFYDLLPPGMGHYGVVGY